LLRCLDYYFGLGGDIWSAPYAIKRGGRIYLGGVAKGPAAQSDCSNVITILPLGFRPQDPMLLPVLANSALGQIDVGTHGAIMFLLGSDDWVSLDNLSFEAATVSC
jgi:hypothetical protein